MRGGYGVTTAAAWTVLLAAAYPSSGAPPCPFAQGDRPSLTSTSGYQPRIPASGFAGEPGLAQPYLSAIQDLFGNTISARPVLRPNPLARGIGKGGVGAVVVPAHHGAAALGERAVGDGRRITSDAGHWPAEAERAAGIGATETATGAGL